MIEINENLECIICLNNIHYNDAYLILSCCKNYIHINCLNNWYKNKNNYVCFICSNSNNNINNIIENNNENINNNDNNEIANYNTNEIDNDIIINTRNNYNIDNCCREFFCILCLIFFCVSSSFLIVSFIIINSL